MNNRLSSEILIVDIEAQSLDISPDNRILLICMSTPEEAEDGYVRVYSDEPGVACDGTIGNAVDRMRNAMTVVMHNGAGFDIPLINCHYPSKPIDINKVYDTLCASRIRYPEQSSHSLEYYSGQNKNLPEKVQIEEWTGKLTFDLIRRCQNDVLITYKIYKKLKKNINYNSVLLETAVLFYHGYQERHGVYIDISKALQNYEFLSGKLNKLKKEIQKELPWRTLIPGVAKSKQEDYKKSVVIKGISPYLKGKTKYKKNTVKYFGEQQVLKVKGDYCAVTFEQFSIDSTADITEYLLSIGWKPTTYNYSTRNGHKVRTSPKLTEDSFSSLPEGLGKKIATYRTIRHRVNFIYNPQKNKGILAEVRKSSKNRVHSYANTCGTPTSRYRHGGVVCNPPRPSSLYGKEVRELFAVPEGCLMVGADLKSIEARCLAHYLIRYPGGQEIADRILSPDKDNDFHTYNARVWDVDRDTAKSGFYALIYGCSKRKLAQTLGKPEHLADKLYDAFWEANAPIKKLIDDLERAYDIRGGKIKGLDGRILYIREKRKLLNSLLQNAATMVFKKWMVLCNETFRELEYPIQQIIAYHDELQFEYQTVFPMTVLESIIEIIKDASLEAGKSFNLNVETPADIKTGLNWAETH